jgi:hypothetical protein
LGSILFSITIRVSLSSISSFHQFPEEGKVTHVSLVQNCVSFVYPKGKEEKLGFILFSMMIRVSLSSISRRGRPILLLFSWESRKGE